MENRCWTSCILPVINSAKTFFYFNNKTHIFTFKVYDDQKNFENGQFYQHLIQRSVIQENIRIIKLVNWFMIDLIQILIDHSTNEWQKVLMLVSIELNFKSTFSLFTKIIYFSVDHSNSGETLFWIVFVPLAYWIHSQYIRFILKTNQFYILINFYF